MRRVISKARATNRKTCRQQPLGWMRALLPAKQQRRGDLLQFDVEMPVIDLATIEGNDDLPAGVHQHCQNLATWSLHKTE